jgi:hypothetical protein
MVVRGMVDSGDWSFRDWQFGDWSFGEWSFGEWSLGEWTVYRKIVWTRILDPGQKNPESAILTSIYVEFPDMGQNIRNTNKYLEFPRKRVYSRKNDRSAEFFELE